MSLSGPASILVGLVALQHLVFLVLEMFLWQKPLGRRVFGHSRDRARQTRVLAANQGLYNGFLAAGLAWVGGVLRGQFRFGLCGRQALPAAVALVAVLWSN